MSELSTTNPIPAAWLALSQTLRDQYNLPADYVVTVIGTELEEIQGAGSDLAEVATEAYNHGQDIAEAIDEAIDERVVVTRAPEGYLFARLTSNQRQPITVMVDAETYRSATPEIKG